MVDDEVVHLGTARGRWVLAATIVGSGIAFLDSTVVNVALPALSRDLDADVAGAQWTITSYGLTLAALILLGGSLGDHYGRRRVYVIGVAWFGVASLLCAIAPTIEVLVAARLLQGVGAALLTPGSLSIISSAFSAEDRPRAIGVWSGLSGVTTLLGPFAGGWLVDAASWRWIFVVNVPLCLAVVFIALRHVPDSRDAEATGRPDLLGATLGSIGLAGITYSLIAAGDDGVSARAVAAAVVGIASFVAFVLAERRQRHPMLPPDIFRERQFTAANLVTFLVYAALSGVLVLLTIQLQVGAGYSALAAGAALAPVTVLMLLLSPTAGSIAMKIGPRLPMALGPAICAVATALLAVSVDTSATYVSDVLPGAVIFGLGLTLTVTPLTATVLGAAPRRHAGVASGVNNAVARGAGLLAIAVLPLAAGLRGDALDNPDAFTAGFRTGSLICAVLLAVGGLVAVATIRNDVLERGPAVSDSVS
jgi:EmrB/QacA subfamily drug resistance transporter